MIDNCHAYTVADCSIDYKADCKTLNRSAKKGKVESDNLALLSGKQKAKKFRANMLEELDKSSNGTDRRQENDPMLEKTRDR